MCDETRGGLFNYYHQQLYSIAPLFIGMKKYVPKPRTIGFRSSRRNKIRLPSRRLQPWGNQTWRHRRCYQFEPRRRPGHLAVSAHPAAPTEPVLSWELALWDPEIKWEIELSYMTVWFIDCFFIFYNFYI